jgi:phosphoribosylaminoimidazolecarboxamide formyltransferase/IMP cyclohydrolase
MHKYDKASISRQSYLTKNTGHYAETISINGLTYKKTEDLRYGTNPHQTAAYYKPERISCPIADMKILKTGKSGLSQTNLEDISYALNIIKFFNKPACAVMKHVNPSGTAVAIANETIKDVYIKARNSDPRASFGSTIAFNCTIDKATAEEIMSTFVECVVAPDINPDALDTFNDSEKYKLNKHIRILKCGDLGQLPKFVGDQKILHHTIKTLADGSLVIAEPLMTNLKSVNEFKSAEAENKTAGKQVSKIAPTKEQAADLLFAWYVNINVRSNGVVIAKNGQTLSIGTGEQDRVGAVEQAIWKYKNKYEGKEEIKDSVMASDGFFPFPDAVEVAAKAGITAIISPAGSLKDADVIKRANELGIALIHAPERIFSHH